jgi:hypothetical protein
LPPANLVDDSKQLRELTVAMELVAKNLVDLDAHLVLSLALIKTKEFHLAVENYLKTIQ